MAEEKLTDLLTFVDGVMKYFVFSLFSVDILDEDGKKSFKLYRLLELTELIWVSSLLHYGSVLKNLSNWFLLPGIADIYARPNESYCILKLG